MTDLSIRTTYVTQERDSARAQINMVHNNVALKVSRDEATRVEDEAKRRLLASRKLSLVVDLDQTIIHATVDPTVGDWQKDESNPNHQAVKDVKSFLLKDDGPGKGGCWYYVKLRPGLEQFLENVSKIYELHIYTMGTRQYAKNIAAIIDPDHRIFGDRILSRDESGSMTAKSLQRLFPVDTKMVVIIDDRGDVWKWSPNLIKVTPYDFFVGIGDINSSFLPKKPDIKPLPKTETTAPLDTPDEQSEGVAQLDPGPSTNGVVHQTDCTSPEPVTEPLVDEHASPLDHIVAMGGGDDPASRSAQSTQQDETIAAQLEERPLLQQQKKLEAEEAEASLDAGTKDEGVESRSESGKSSDSEKPKQNLLRDHDRELYTLEESLRSVHTAFFEDYAQQLAGMQGGRLGQLRGTKKPKLAPETSDLDLVPDVKTVMPTVKLRVLENTVIVFSGMVPLGMDVGTTDLAIQTTSFGAKLDEDVTKHTTHLVAARNRTQKVRTAMRKRKGRIKIVSPEWLYDSISSWTKKDETPYLLDVEEPKNDPVDEEGDIWSESESLAEDESEDTDTTDGRQAQRTAKPKKLKLQPPRSDANDKESVPDGEGIADFEYDDKSPVCNDEDWTAMHDELKDFLGSEAEDSDDDNDSLASDKSTNSRAGFHSKKRSREEYESGGEGAAEEKSQKRQNPGTSLSQSTLADEDEGAGEGEGDEGGDNEVELEESLQEGDGWSDFGDEEFEAELEKAASDGQEGVSPT